MLPTSRTIWDLKKDTHYTQTLGFEPLGMCNQFLVHHIRWVQSVSKSSSIQVGASGSKLAFCTVSLLLWAGMQMCKQLRHQQEKGQGPAGPLGHPVSSLFLFWFPPSSSVYTLAPRPGVGQFSQAVFAFSGFSYLFFSASLVSFHLSLKEKEKQSSSSAALITNYFFLFLTFST